MKRKATITEVILEKDRASNYCFNSYLGSDKTQTHQKTTAIDPKDLAEIEAMPLYPA